MKSAEKLKPHARHSAVRDLPFDIDTTYIRVTLPSVKRGRNDSIFTNWLVQLSILMMCLVFIVMIKNNHVCKVEQTKRRHPTRVNIDITIFEDDTMLEFPDAELRGEGIAKLNLDHVPSNPYNLSSTEIEHQYKTAKVASLKARVRRFACWHSCFGEFHKRTFRKRKPKVTFDAEVPRLDKDFPDPGPIIDELNANSGPREKKSPNPAGFYEEIATNELPDKINTTSQRSPDKLSLEATHLKEKSVHVEKTTEAVKVVLQSELEKVEKPAKPSAEELEYESYESGENEDADGAAGESYEGDDGEYYDDDKTGDGTLDGDADNTDDGIDQEGTEEDSS
ncbi:hypothetical protein Ocin01_10158 [Orchesella cincta]|uniref:Uncharacterized protein n=1 Tax=Orchesella cincta TaxID=48709 RepID=A0A1D2MUB2_ORCCI|nr:hypothetical protein Ocin01_10158 [Orchesella cincta]